MVRVGVHLRSFKNVRSHRVCALDGGGECIRLKPEENSVAIWLTLSTAQMGMFVSVPMVYPSLGPPTRRFVPDVRADYGTVQSRVKPMIAGHRRRLRAHLPRRRTSSGQAVSQCSVP